MEKEQNHLPVMERFISFLNSNHLRKTPERFEILKVALSCKGHFDVERLNAHLEEQGYHVSKATIYSTLELLCTSGVVRKLLFDTHQARYEIAEVAHSHLICTQCGRISEVNLEGIDIKLAEMKFKGFTPAYVSTCIYGICSECRKKTHETKV